MSGSSPAYPSYRVRMPFPPRIFDDEAHNIGEKIDAHRRLTLSEW